MPLQLPLDLPHRPSLTREDLVVSASNRLPVEAVDRWPDWSHPVLVVCGPPGSGKTHLANVWAERTGAVVARPGMIDAILPHPPFAVVLDDLDRGGFAEKELFALLNAARLGGGSVLATSRVLPTALDFSLKDLRSRLSAATLVQLGAPDDDLLTSVLVKLFSDRQLDVEPGAVRYLAERMERSLDRARQLVAAVDREALATKGRVTRPLMKRVLLAQAEPAEPRHEAVAPDRYATGTMEDD
ncbi:DnaA ATPase domain-containing protein [Aurantimonas sp. VKM B-3413]|uniref:HdaA/DnaA family protein n=1 Tax=Aurantimonas sp. VKM B-3413 TaxID=2779401 RepID=UPI001E3386FA|nr:DnaA/Hda family protein [Aurantimonas sp. VKM B-3413]MCB8836001.1 hypothetical protein [Aurantimonas sp. VKM B-3413]